MCLNFASPSPRSSNGCSVRRFGPAPQNSRRIRGRVARSYGCSRKFNMARNRKNQSAAVRFGPAVKALLICLFIGGSGIGYVWQQNQLLELGRQKAEKEKRLNLLRVQNSQLGRHLAEHQSAKTLETLLTEL